MGIELVNIILVNAIALWKKAREADPNAATYTDEQVIDLLGSDSQGALDKGNAFLAELASRPKS